MNDFKKEHFFYKKAVDAAVSRVFESGWYILGKEVERFEKLFASYTGTEYCVGVANGLEALQISLMAFGIGRGDEVITVSNSAVATALAITNTGADVVFADIDDYYHMDTANLEKLINKRTKAIMPVHLFGQVVNIEDIIEIAKKYNLKVIEDACQAVGAEFKGRKAGSFGDIGCFSFYPTKNLGTYGDGGAITVNSKELYEKCKMLRNYGQKNRYQHVIKGLNSRLDEIHAAILSEKLPLLDKLIKRRNEIAKIYLNELKDIEQIELPKSRYDSKHTYHLFVLEAEKRDELRDFLKLRGIETQVHYPIPIHKQECYRELNQIFLPRTERVAGRLLSLPIHPFLTKKEVIGVCNAVKDFYRRDK